MTILNAANSCMQLIGSQTASSSASISFTNLSAAYFKYILEFDSLIPASTASLYLTMSTNNGSSYLGSTLYAYQLCYNTSSTASGAGNLGVAQIYVHPTTITSSDSLSGKIELYNLGGGQSYKLATMQTYQYDSSSPYEASGGGAVNTSSAVNAIKLAMSTGNITSGTFKLYGVMG